MGFFCLPSVFSHSCFLVGCLDCLEVEAWQVGPMGTSWGGGKSLYTVGGA